MTTFEPFEGFGDLDEISGQLQSPDPSVRRLAVIELVETSTDEAVPLLARAVGDADAGGRLQAARALGDFDGVDVAKALTGILVDSEAGVAQAAADSLAELRDPGTSVILLPLVTHPSSFVRAAILCAMKALQVGASLGPAIAALGDNDPAVRAQAVGVVGYLKLIEALPSLIHATKDGHPDVRLAAVDALSFARNEAGAQAAADALSDPEWQVRAVAAETIGRIGQTSVTTPLTVALNDSYWQVRQKALQSVGKLRLRGAVRAIIPFREDELPSLRKDAGDPDVRKTVSWALQRIEAR
ncbi:HEAT repeat domain-containing protein [Bradyrhizobium sp. Arg62]|uniref:HEAT repeat domain-containing protein n=1 Tax=Bradyrhizobium TaxID=374 RepID=UPI001E4C615B|nr:MULTISPECIES: HEAT repeat domain-containing protein [Bradyrhizobium]MCC8940558.1 HEAT repeat domain-containing protein [Bradyrhizobium ivorense]MCC8950121.1 HEAT repeat domain-containing protein [Bradyrhizobium brasilense]